MRLETFAAVSWLRKLISRYAHINLALSDQVVLSGANFITGLLLARHLGIEQFGQFSLAWLVVLFVQSVQQVAIISPMMSIGSKQKANDLGNYYAVVFFHQLLFALSSTILTIAGLLVAGRIFPSVDIGDLVWPLGAVVLVSQIQEFLRRYYFSTNRPHISLVTDVVRYGAQTAVLLWLFLWSGWIVTIETVYWIILATAAAGILAVSFNVHDLEWPAGGWGEISLRHWHFSKWLLASNLLSWASGHVFILFAGAIIGAAAVGTLRAAQNVMAVTHVLFLGLGNFLPVRASEVYTEGGIVRLKKFLWKASVFVISTTLVFASIVCVFADQILTLLYGSTYGDYGWVLIGYALIYVLVALGTVIPIGLLALERTFPFILARGMAVSFSIVAAYPLVAVYGLAGVLFGIIVVESILVAVPYLAFRRIVATLGDQSPIEKGQPRS